MDKFSETYKLSKPLQEVDNLNRPKRSKGIVLVLSSVSHSVMSDSPCPQTVAHQPPLSMEFSKQGYWSGLPFPSPGDLPDTGIEPWCPVLHKPSAKHSEEFFQMGPNLTFQTSPPTPKPP